MFNIGPLELMVLAVVGLVVLGPDRLPGLARDAGRMLKTLRELATGARTQLRDELGPEFADVDLRSLNPRTALQRAILGDENDFSSLNPRKSFRDMLSDDEDDPISMQKASAPGPSVEKPSMEKPSTPGPSMQKSVRADEPAAPVRPLGRGEAVPYDTDAT